jgi:hypothetical protein
MPDDTAPIDIKAIAEELNMRAKTHAIGKLQTIRAELRGFARRPGTDIFSPQTIHEGWAFHHGGRSELQFNIGKEADGSELRHGVAFSFETSRTLPSIETLIPKARCFNDYMQQYPSAYADMRMWYHQNDERSSDYPPAAVTAELVTEGTFVFLGKCQPSDKIDYEIILNDFDRLLPLFKYVESNGKEEALVTDGFNFRAGFTDKSAATTATLAERELDINLKHNLLQAALCRRLKDEFGADNIGDEQVTPIGTKIDVVVRRSKDEFWYYEIKTALSPRACLREAFGQLMEYAYWPGAQEAKRLIICGESPLDDVGEKYLLNLKSRFRLPIEYKQIIL